MSGIPTVTPAGRPTPPDPSKPSKPSKPGPSGPAGRLDWPTVRTALGLLRQPLWARVALAVVLLSVAFVFLGRWQYGRHEAKVARNQRIDANYAAAPVPLAAVLAGPASALPDARQWTPVQVTGSYQPDATLVVRNRPLQGVFGYEVLVPLRLPSGAALLIDRGWIPPGGTYVKPDSIPAPPTGTVTVVTRLRPGEPADGHPPPAGQLDSVDLARLATAAGGEVYRGGYGVLARETPTVPTAPTLLPRPNEDLGPHLAYAFQWWLGAVAGYVLLGVYGLREARTRRDAARSATSSSSSTGPGTGPGTPDGPTERPGMAGALAAWWQHRAARRGPSDEEIEDAAGQ
jgi:cytochrome oxidase assembly protein ShyY1